MTAAAASVVVVDDDASVRRGLERLLRSAGYKVQTFASARDLLQWAQLKDIDCLVLDVRMPGLGGLELYEALSGTEQDVSVVFITGHGDVPIAVKAMKAGAVDFLAKPLDDEVLLDAVTRAVARSRRRREMEGSERIAPRSSGEP